FGHWEIDTVLGGKTKDQNCVFSLVERKTRYYLPIKVASKDSKSIKEAFQSLVYSFKSNVSEVFKSITCDNGSEFSEMHTFEYLSDIYFAHPFSSYERGTNERHNGLLRRFLPKGTSMNKVSKEEILHYGDLINGLPRKIFNYKTPEALFEEEMDKVYSVL
ncbi:IS30 family transposase, partial [Peptostreptococcus faecalis]|uniref:IS30 family transposase n=1 Tax=Peptostreptococcus faecalis TaxID=2045015 RepID=UPI0011AF2175